MLFSAVVTVIMIVFASQRGLMRVLENRSGFIADTYLGYLAARFCITDRKALLTVVKWVAVALVPLACLGVVESVTGWQPFRVWKLYCPWAGEVDMTAQMRHGFYRAVGPHAHPILFGTAFVLFAPLVRLLRHERGRWKRFGFFATVMAFVGALTSMSSGPWVMAIVTVFCLYLEKHKNWVRSIVITFIVGCAVVGIISNRTFYHVLASYANPLGGSGWHRARLIDLAVEHFDEWWLVGYGDRDMGWGKSLGMTWTDITNEYIMFAVNYGLIGVIALCGILFGGIYKLYLLNKQVKDRQGRSIFWALGSIIAVLTLSFNSCALFGQAFTFFYVIIGMVGASDNLIAPASQKVRARRVSTVQRRPVRAQPVT
jgi:hypothetical protein